MKKLISIVFLLFLLLPLRAQEEDLCARQLRSNEIGLSVNVGTGYQAAAILAGSLTSFVGSIVKNDFYLVIPVPIPFSLEYDHWFNDKLAAGISLNTDLISALPYLMVGNLSAMPVVKYSWMNDQSIRIYSKAALGFSATMLSMQDDYNDGKMETQFVTGFDYLKKLNNEGVDLAGRPLSDYVAALPSALLLFKFIPLFGVQLSPLCVDISTASKNLDFFLELGFGTLGAANCGFKMYF